MITVEGVDRVRFAAIMEMLPDAIIGVDDRGTVIVVNTRALSLFGLTRDAVIGQPVNDLLPGSSRATLARQSSRGARQPAESPRTVLQLMARRKDGMDFLAEISLVWNQLGGGAVATLAIRDVTERKRGKANFRGVVESADDAAVGVDRAGLIAVVNPEAEEMFGYSRRELIDQPLNMLVPQPVSDGLNQRGSQFRQGHAGGLLGAGKPLEGRRKDGSEFPVEISLSAIETDGGALVSAAIRDASDRPETRLEQARATVQSERDLLESRLHQSHRLESLGQLAGGVAHDFNNLLAAILNYVGFVAEGIAEEIQVQPGVSGARLTAVLNDVGQIGAAAERAAALTHQLLAFARREVRNLEVLDINRIVSEVETLLRRTIGEQVELITRGARDLSAVRADHGQIEQILLNLAVNARDAMPNGGTLSIDTDNFHVDDDYATLRPAVIAGPYVRLRVTDTGMGMDEETADRAFEPFFSTKTKDKGTGLGLATVYGIVSQMAGMVELRSEVGVGTTVTILLPSIPSASTEPQIQRPASRQSSGETVLVVEDEELVLDVATRILRQHGYRVIPARSGAEALALLESHEGAIDLLLTDVVMPGATGKDVAIRVTELRPAIRVLYMSGYPESVIASQGVIDQGITLLSKPFKAPDLLDHVRAALDAPVVPSA